MSGSNTDFFHSSPLIIKPKHPVCGYDIIRRRQPGHIHNPVLILLCPFPMTFRPFPLLVLTLTAFFNTPCIHASKAFSAMDVSEIASVVDASLPARSTACTDTVLPLPLQLTATDMIENVYGFVDPLAGKEKCIDCVKTRLRLCPDQDNGAMWLDNDRGYSIDYSGMLPPVTAMARYGDSGAEEYAYFFLFPYASGQRRITMQDQTDFCGSMLQEMADMGLQMDLLTGGPDLFEAVGEHCGSLVDIRLLDEKHPEGSGRFILLLSIEPNAFTPADNLTALTD